MMDQKDKTYWAVQALKAIGRHLIKISLMAGASQAYA